MYWCRLIFLVFCAGLPIATSAQLKFRDAPNRQTPDFIDENEADELWMQSLYQQGIGTFEFLFNLEYRPFREPTVVLPGRMIGDWKSNQRTTRFEVLDKNGKPLQNILLQLDLNGLLIHQLPAGEDTIEILSHDEIYTNLIENIPLTGFNLGMPFWFWEERHYIGPDRVLGRPVHLYRVINPSKNDPIQVVEIAIDHAFAAPLEATFFDGSENKIQEFKVRSIRKEGEQWIAKHWSFNDLVNKSSIHLKLLDVSFGVELESASLAPSKLKEEIQVIRN